MNTILLSEPIEESAIKLLEGKAQVVVSPDPSDATVGRLLPEADALILRTATRVIREMHQKAPRLKVVSRTGGGLNNVDVEAATDHRVVVCGVKGPQDRYVAEHAVMMMGSLAKHFPYLDSQTRKSNFRSRFEYRPMGLAGKRVGLIGLGRIGRIVADMCVNAFRMEVWAYDPYVQAESLKEKNISLRSDRSEVVKTADFLSLHVPLTDETRGLIGKEQLAMMKPTAFLINTSRGEIYYLPGGHWFIHIKRYPRSVLYLRKMRKIRLGIAMVPDYIGSDDYRVAPLPFLKYTFGQSQRYVKLAGSELSLNLLNHPNFQLGPLIRYYSPRDDNVKDDVVEKMDKVDGGFAAGGFLTFELREGEPRNRINFTLKFVADISDSYSGYLMDFDVTLWRKVAERWDAFVGAGTTYADNDYMDTYFSVNSGNRGAAPVVELPKFSAGSGIVAVKVFAANVLAWVAGEASALSENRRVNRDEQCHHRDRQQRTPIRGDA